MTLSDYCNLHKKIVIYGTGSYGQALAESHLLTNSLRCFVLSDGINHESILKGIPVFSISEYASQYREDDEGILIATSFSNHDDIVRNLREVGIVDWYIVTRDEYPMKLIREKHPVDAHLFLSSVEPVSRAFGAERGLPVDRYYINKYLKEVSAELKHVRTTMEIGEDRYASELFPGETEHIILRYENGEDLTDISTLPLRKCDVFICTQTLNFIYKVRDAIDGLYYLIDDDGYLIGSVQGNIGQVAKAAKESYGDYWRFTEEGIKRVLTETFGENNVETRAYGNVLSATAFIQGVAIEDIVHKDLLDYCDPLYSICVCFRCHKIMKP